ncbi:MAG: DUF1697 domain-containing protein [Bacteroidetes bacterium]|nr:MAG: DUF1697 domain-containing protein [Bacteroidota bacterium]
MTTYISLLRGINVSGQKKINMQDLKALYESTGLQDVLTYIQSGNVIFKSDKEDTDELTTLIAQAIQAKYGFDVAVFVRTVPAFEAIVANNPFVGEATEKLYFTLLAQTPLPEKIANIDTQKHLPDRFALVGQDLYLCVESYGTTKFSNNFFENKWKVVATTRNYNTMLKLIELAR